MDLSDLNRSQFSLVTLSIAALGIGLLFQAFEPVFMKLSEAEISPNAVIFHRHWMAGIVLLIWQRSQRNHVTNASASADQLAKKTPFPYTTETLGWLLFMGGVCALNQLFWIWSFTQTRIASSAFTYYSLTPVFAVLGEFIFLGKRFKLRFLMGMAVAIAGIAIIGFSDWHVNSEQLKGDALAVIGTLCFSIYFLSAQKLQTTVDTITILIWRCLVTVIVTVPLLFVGTAPIFPTSLSGWFMVLGVAVTLAGQFFIIRSFTVLSVSLVGICLMLDPIIAAVVARITFAEAIGVMTWIAVPIILLGVYLCSVDGLPNQSPSVD